MTAFNNLCILGAFAFAITPIVGGLQPPQQHAQQSNYQTTVSSKDIPAKLENGLREAGINDTKFANVMIHILQVEGGFSNHPADRGGATKYGIIAERARQHGINVYTITLSQALRIYYSDYWVESGANKAPAPLDLAIMNSYVNSGKRWKIIGRNSTEQAINYLMQQDKFYNRIITKSPSQRVFEKGWNNRTQYMLQQVKQYEIRNNDISNNRIN